MVVSHSLRYSWITNLWLVVEWPHWKSDGCFQRGAVVVAVALLVSFSNGCLFVCVCVCVSSRANWVIVNLTVSPESKSKWRRRRLPAVITPMPSRIGCTAEWNRDPSGPNSTFSATPKSKCAAPLNRDLLRPSTRTPNMRYSISHSSYRIPQCPVLARSSSHQ